MKIHITNLYGLNNSDVYVQKHHQFALAGRSLGFSEIGIFSYPVETDTERELSTRLDGIIASLQSDDIVIMQLPSTNGYKFEQKLINKIKAYRNTKTILLLHDMNTFFDASHQSLKNEYVNLFKMADSIIVPSSTCKQIFQYHGIDNILYCDSVAIAEYVKAGANVATDNHGYLQLCHSDFYIKKLLMDAISSIYQAQQLQQQYSNTTDKMQDIHIGFGLYDKTGNYSVWVGVTMQSIIEHTHSKMCFHILHDCTLNSTNKDKLTQVATQSGHRIQFHLLDETLFSGVAELMRNYTIGAMFRIMLPELLTDLSKIIYLDADLLVNRDILELWNTDIADYCLAAVPDSEVINGSVTPIAVKLQQVSAKRYFNSGVLYMNLDNIRQDGNMCKRILSYIEQNNSTNLPDQDALNALYNNKTLLLDGSWNYFARNVHIRGEKKIEKKIYHYVGLRPVFYYHTEMDELYFKTISRTPWGIEHCTSLMRRSLERTTYRIDRLEKLLHHIAASNKKRIFYGDEINSMRKMYELLTIREGDYRILSQPDSSKDCILPCKEFSALANETEPYIVLVLFDADNGQAIKNLEQLGLKMNEDFFEIRSLLEPYDGGFL